MMSNDEGLMPSVNPDDGWFNLLDVPQRATSAPPNLELTSKTLFAFRSEYSPFFGDIRLEENYEGFYDSYKGPAKLPPPIQKQTLSVDFLDSKDVNSPRIDEMIKSVIKEGYQSPSVSNIANFKPKDPFYNYNPLMSKFEGLQVNDTWEAQQMQPKNGPWNAPQRPVAHQPIARPQPTRVREDPNLLSPFHNNLQETNSFYNNLFVDMQQPNSSDPIMQPSGNKHINGHGAISPQPIRSPSPQLPISHAHNHPHPHPHPHVQPTPTYSSVASNTSHLSVSIHSPNRPVSPQISSPTQNSPQPSRGQHQRSSSSSKLDDLDSGKSDSPKSREFKYNTIEECVGRIYSLAKDQYGCRFLQKKLEDNNRQECNAIFNEVYEHIVELMTDPFGNYLCQKLLEHCTDQQKVAIIRRVAPEIVNISLNMHGTRAVQKLIECLNTPTQIQMVIDALRTAVVTLIKDLNGNHVIQRCLHRLSVEDKQFIYDAVAGKCVDVATHRHGCCVLQRCIDFASDRQKMQLVNEITANALGLVQDPFGNYVVQYILDLGIDMVNVEVIKKFVGHIADLSTNKFSSNVIEKCLRLAPISLRAIMVQELMEDKFLSHLLQDSYANYVIQTAMTVAETPQFQMFAEKIKPMITLIKNTPYGKKIENKLNKRGMGTAMGPSKPSPNRNENKFHNPRR